ncbi:hypothetical protein GBAR_LOCUS27615, partial [Geodia barretti]
NPLQRVPSRHRGSADSAGSRVFAHAQCLLAVCCVTFNPTAAVQWSVVECTYQIHALWSRLVWGGSCCYIKRSK